MPASALYVPSAPSRSHDSAGNAGMCESASPRAHAPAASRTGGCARTPRTVGDYELGKTLGTGATGKVKIARHVRSGELVAIKAIPKAVLRNKPAIAAKVRREIAVLKLLGGVAAREHGGGDVGVLSLLDVYETEAFMLLILEYCAGGDLFEAVLNNGYFPSDECLAIFQQLVLGLRFAHRQGVGHRDLKLENLLFTEDGRLKVADFGMASLMMPGSLLETACGSPNYCAPEVLSGELYNGAAADVWSCGVILFALATGGLPFDDDNFSRLYTKVRAGVFSVPDEVDEQIADLIRGMLRVNPSERVTLTDIMQTPWFHSRPLPPHMSTLHSFVPRPVAATSPSHDRPSTSPEPSPKTSTLSPSSSALPSPSSSPSLPTPRPPTLALPLAAPPLPAPVSTPTAAPPSPVLAGRSRKPPPLRLDDDGCATRPREHAPVVNPAMPIVVHLTELGLGEIPTILRRLRADRPCIEKDFYTRLSAFVGISATESRAIAEELPVSPNTDASAEGRPIPSESLPASLAGPSRKT